MELFRENVPVFCDQKTRRNDGIYCNGGLMGINEDLYNKALMGI